MLSLIKKCFALVTIGLFSNTSLKQLFSERNLLLLHVWSISYIQVDFNQKSTTLQTTIPAKTVTEH